MAATDHLLIPVAAFEPVPEWLPECGALSLAPREWRLLASQLAMRALPLWLAEYPQDDRPAQAIWTAMKNADGAGAIDPMPADYPPPPRYCPAPAHFAYGAGCAVIDPDPGIPHSTASAGAVTAARYNASVPSSAEAAERERHAQRRLRSLYMRCDWPDSWRTDAVRGVAEAIYTGQDWQSVPILADALDDAGCHSSVWLRWLRSGEMLPHWHRGQWPFDFGRGVCTLSQLSQHHPRGVK